MKRWAVKLALCTLAGAVVTWAVAWGCAQSMESGSRRMRLVTVSVPALGDCHAAFFDCRTCEQWDVVGLPPVELAPPRAVPPTWALLPVSRGDAVHTYAYGIPFKSLRASIHLTGAPPNSVRVDRSMLEMWNARWPVGVIPLGFAMNTGIAASVVLLIGETIDLIRRRSRTRRGLCPACGYDRRGIDAAAACPECGGVNA